VASSTDLASTLGGTLFDSSSWLIEMVEPFLGLLSIAALQERKAKAFSERKERGLLLEKRLTSRTERIARVKASLSSKTPTASGSKAADDGEIVDIEDCNKAIGCGCETFTSL
jgi:hypothetical protein